MNELYKLFFYSVNDAIKNLKGDEFEECIRALVNYINNNKWD